MINKPLKIDDYKGKRETLSYPEDNIDPKLKEQESYYIAYCNAMMADYVNGACEVPFDFGNRRSFEELRAYATGKQGSAKLKDRVIGAHKKDKNTGLYNTKMNISWDNLDILPKMFDVMREKNMKTDYEIDAVCVDSDSLQAKEADRETLKFLIDKSTKEFMDRMGYKPRTPVDPQQAQMRSEEDVDLYFDTGAYTFQREMASIAACSKTKLVSKYKAIQDKTFDDLISWGISGWKTYIDNSTNEVKIRYVDCSKAIIPYSKLNDFSDIVRGGEIRTMTIADLRKECPWLKPAELLYIAKSFSYLNPTYKNLLDGNALTSTGSRSQYMVDYSIDPINRCQVLVLDCQWLSSDIENHVKNDRPSGKTFFKEVDYDYEPSKDRQKKGDRLIQKNVIRKYYAKWVIGTDILLDNGICKDVVYYGEDGNKCPKLDYWFTKTGNSSLVERCIAIVDDIDLANIKLRNTLSTAIPGPRMIIQTGLMDNIFLNGIKQEPEDGMQTFLEKGYLFVNAVDDFGKPIYTNQKMVDFMPSGIMEDLNAFSSQIIAGINNLREVLGLPQGADASTPNPYVGARKSELSLQSSNAALYPTFNAFQYLFENAFDDVVKKWQIIAKQKPVNLHYSPLGSRNLKILELGGDFANAEFNIAISMQSSEQQLQQLMQDITQAKAVGVQTGGEQGISYGEYLMLYEKIMGGNIKEAMYIMAQLEKRKIDQKRQDDQNNQQATFKGQQDSADAKAKNDQETLKEEGTQSRLTAIVTEGQKRKTAATNQFLKSFEAAGQPLPEILYQQIIHQADSEIATALGQGQPTPPPMSQDSQQQQNVPPPQGEGMPGDQSMLSDNEGMEAQQPEQQLI